MKKLLYLLCFMPQLIHAMSFKNACLRDDVAQVTKIVAKDPSILNGKTDTDGFLPIHYAAYNSSLKVLQLLLDIKPSLIDETDARGNIPFAHVFMGIDTLRQKEPFLDVEICAINFGYVMKSGYSSREEARDSIKQQRCLIAQELENFKRAIDLFISRRANLDISNMYGKKWSDMPGLDKELSDYAREQIAKSLK